MEIIWTQAVLAGVVGVVLMTMAMFAGRVMGLSTDMVRAIGLVFVPDSDRHLVYLIGISVHLFMGAIFGLTYALLLTAVGAVGVLGAAAAWGALFGAIHGVVVGAGLGILPAVHPRMGPGEVLSAPGFFGHNVGVGMPVFLIMLHIIYGIFAAVVYSVGVA
ncbi:hypothetical protein DV096_06935 [Bradymonadaceae bacterium TMQ3]|uniref:DUF2938 domain-containing protein n=1 Tax=Lujinxingia sediminis TaxID=2480984 RepID=A0ABY0CUB4_9DELT|nr:hypothetical protein [Lujinxingia sediminis]RDV38543.1 hypothetical protein DV096_06935 [Bradymonadaceae bacterium TMQ3]RVU44910.1 hypothetical protein EA187_10255 [Lujinxingia sediminis]TXC76689.1 hypothetical protein FRC91_08130 [Bradymonadales bacterium TMQ1]